MHSFVICEYKRELLTHLRLRHSTHYLRQKEDIAMPDAKQVQALETESQYNLQC
jgi:hypothetical protein